MAVDFAGIVQFETWLRDDHATPDQFRASLRGVRYVGWLRRGVELLDADGADAGWKGRALGEEIARRVTAIGR